MLEKRRRGSINRVEEEDEVSDVPKQVRDECIQYISQATVRFRFRLG